MGTHKWVIKNDTDNQRRMSGASATKIWHLWITVSSGSIYFMESSRHDEVLRLGPLQARSRAQANTQQQSFSVRSAVSVSHPFANLQHNSQQTFRGKFNVWHRRRGQARFGVVENRKNEVLRNVLLTNPTLQRSIQDVWQCTRLQYYIKFKCYITPVPSRLLQITINTFSALFILFSLKLWRKMLIFGQRCDSFCIDW